MAWDEALAARIRADLADHLIIEKRMFGGLAWMLRGNMLCGLIKQAFMFRVGPELEAEALARPGAQAMDFTGRRMRGFILVDPDAALDAGLEDWIALAERYVRALPPKGVKEPRRAVR